MCRFESGVVIGVLFYGEAAQMVDGRRTVNPIHQKLRKFESLLSHKIFIGGFTAYKGNKFLAPLYQLYSVGNTFVKLVQGNFTFYASVAELV